MEALELRYCFKTGPSFLLLHKFIPLPTWKSCNYLEQYQIIFTRLIRAACAKFRRRAKNLVFSKSTPEKDSLNLKSQSCELSPETIIHAHKKGFHKSNLWLNSCNCYSMLKLIAACPECVQFKIGSLFWNYLWRLLNYFNAELYRKRVKEQRIWINKFAILNIFMPDGFFVTLKKY